MTLQSALVTGGAGFIGSHLCETLLASGCRVTIIDNLATGRWANCRQVEKHPNFRAIIASAEDERIVEKEVAEHEVVYHLASAVGVRLIIDKPVETVGTIFRATDVVLNACARYRRPILITSTSEVYGKSDRVPFQEDADVVMGATAKRRWAYACAKALDEFLGLAHYYESSLPVYIVRLFNTVGPRQTGQYGMVLPTFVRQAIEGRPLTVYGTGNQRRCFCSVFDVVRALVRLTECPQAIGKVVNLGTEEEISMLALAERVITLCRSESPIELIPYDKAYGPGFDDMMRRVPDCSRARDLIGWRPEHRLDDVILQIAEDIRKGTNPQ